MFHSTTLLAVVAAFSAFTSAQNYSTTGPLSVDPNSIPSSLRQTWCRAQTTSCPQICGGRAQPNTCDPVSRIPRDPALPCPDLPTN
jgi:hypothetical protein